MRLAMSHLLNFVKGSSFGVICFYIINFQFVDIEKWANSGQFHICTTDTYQVDSGNVSRGVEDQGATCRMCRMR
jgi:hypothetical protein